MEKIVRHYALIDEILDARRSLFGGAGDGLRAHAYRVLNFSRQWIEPSPERDDKLAICACFHDMAIYPERTLLNYLDRSAEWAAQYLDETGRFTWKREMELMIKMHHKIRTYHGEAKTWVEPIRRADWIDVLMGTVRFGLPAEFVREVRATFPLGWWRPRVLVMIVGKYMITHPWDPLPMMRL